MRSRRVPSRPVVGMALFLCAALPAACGASATGRAIRPAGHRFVPLLTAHLAQFQVTARPSARVGRELSSTIAIEAADSDDVALLSVGTSGEPDAVMGHVQSIDAVNAESEAWYGDDGDLCGSSLPIVGRGRGTYRFRTHWSVPFDVSERRSAELVASLGVQATLVDPRRPLDQRRLVATVESSVEDEHPAAVDGPPQLVASLRSIRGDAEMTRLLYELTNASRSDVILCDVGEDEVRLTRAGSTFVMLAGATNPELTCPGQVQVLAAGESSWRELYFCEPETTVQRGDVVEVVLEVGTGGRRRADRTALRLTMRAVADSDDPQVVRGEGRSVPGGPAGGVQGTRTGSAMPRAHPRYAPHPGT